MASRRDSVWAMGAQPMHSRATRSHMVRDVSTVYLWLLGDIRLAHNGKAKELLAYGAKSSTWRVKETLNGSWRRIPSFLGMRMESCHSYRESPRRIRGDVSSQSHLHAHRQSWASRCGVLFGGRAGPVIVLGYTLSRLDHLRAS